MKRHRYIVPLAVLPALAVMAGGLAGTAAAKVRKVDCDKGQSIQAKLDKTNAGDTIEITGACTENVVVSRNRISMTAGPGGGSIASAAPTGSVILVEGRDVRVLGLTVPAVGRASRRPAAGRLRCPNRRFPVP